MKNLLLLFFLISTAAMADISSYPPYQGTLSISNRILTDQDPTVFSKLVADGQKYRKMFDRRINGWKKFKAHIFIAQFSDSAPIEVQVNSEFDSLKARELAEKYLKSIGRLPFCLRQNVESVWIHDGNEDFGGGNKNILIHVGRANIYQDQNILEETFIHEAVHTSLDHIHSLNKNWQIAQQKDGKFISYYARDNSVREDLAESFLMYFACRYKPHVIDRHTLKTVCDTIPNRILYFDSLNLNMFPVLPI